MTFLHHYHFVFDFVVASDRMFWSRLFNPRKYPFHPSLRKFSQVFGDHPTFKWLLNKGYSKPIAEGIMKAFPSKPSVAEISSLGESGLKALSEAVAREVKDHTVPTINVCVGLPKSKGELHLKAVESDTFYDLVEKNKELSYYLECACRGIGACSTCHVFVDPQFKDKLPPPEINELDMLDLAWGSNDNSRLGCQIKLTPALDGLKVTIPEHSNNMYAR